MSRVIILRHAKAEKLAETDFARPLSQRGHQQTKECRNWISGLPFKIDQALVSSSLRTRETWEDLKLQCPVAFSDDAYNASAEQLVHLIRQFNDGTETILIVGHNPGVTDLAFAHGFHGELATCAAVVINLDGDLAHCGLIEGDPAQVFEPVA